MLQALIARVTGDSRLNFALTNRIPRAAVTRLVAWISRIEQPLVRDLSIAVWQRFAGDLELQDARKTRFRSLHDCFVRELKPGARPIDATPGVLVSPSDGIVMACGRIEGPTLVQAKGMEYELAELVQDAALAARLRGGSYVTLRLTSTMYHRFHAPDAGRIDGVAFVPGDTWNVNPAALARVPRLYCRNTRAVLPMHLQDSDGTVVLVAVGAILVASIRLSFLPFPLERGYAGRPQIPCRAVFARGDELGFFQHGSTIVALADAGYALDHRVTPGLAVRAGQLLWRGAPAPDTHR